ncbi:MAG: hypothetical protein AABZ55_02390 [Bdellovibrionota bacterium]
MPNKKRHPLLLILISIGILAFNLSCAQSTSTDIRETGQQIGDSMASIDESAGSTGNFALLEGASHTFARLAPREIRGAWIEEILASKAFASTCYGSGFTCGGVNTGSRTFSNCTIGTATLSGSVSFTYTGTGATTCTIPGNSDSVTRIPNFTATGLRGATLSVTGASGQVVTRTNGLAGAAATLSFQNTGGIRRVFTTATSTLFDFTTTTSSAITITGTTRGSRSVSGGALVVTNNISTSTYSSCTFSPSSVTWGSSSCNCPTSGTWSGSCTKRSDSSLVGASLTFNGCGLATYSLNGETESFSLDRCSSS